MVEDERLENYKKILNFIDRIEVTKTLDQFIQKLSDDFKGVELRSKLFVQEFDANFPKHSFERITALTSLKNNIHDVVMLYLLNQKSAVIIELHSELETLSIFYLSTILCKEQEDKRKDMVQRLRKKSLPYFTQEWLKLKVWDDNDVEFSKRLSNIRNGIAHKNLDRVREIFGIDEFGGQMLSKYFVEEEIMPLIMNCLKLEIKLLQTQVKLKIPFEQTYQRAKDANII